MSLADSAQRLERSFRISQRLLSRLLGGLCERRTAWISARPGAIAPSAELEAIAAELQAEDLARRSLIRELAQLLPTPPGAAPGQSHVNVSRIAAALPARIAHTLRAAADEATSAATKVRRELAFGRRLLDFAQRTHDGLMLEVAAGARSNTPTGYDRTANARRGTGRVGATLVDGRM